MRTCACCNQEKEFSEFYRKPNKHNTIKYFKDCKKCLSDRQKALAAERRAEKGNNYTKHNGTAPDPIAREILATNPFWNELKKQDEEETGHQTL